MSPSTQIKYESVLDKAEAESLASSAFEDTDALFQHNERQVQRQRGVVRVLAGICIILTTTLLGLIIYAIKYSTLSDNQCARQLSTEGPALAAVQYQTIRFKGAQDDDNPYKGHPRPELDAAWTELTEVRHVSITPENLAAIGKSHNDAVQLPDGNYLGATEAFHQLHCLNLIRQHSYKEWYDVDGRRPPGLTDSATTLRHHVDHCIDILRQNIMCQADTSVITHNWVQGYQFPYPNFNTQHKCRDFDKLVAWEKAHQTEDPARPDDAVVLKTPPTT